MSDESDNYYGLELDEYEDGFVEGEIIGWFVGEDNERASLSDSSVDNDIIGDEGK